MCWIDPDVHRAGGVVAPGGGASHETCVNWIVRTPLLLILHCLTTKNPYHARPFIEFGGTGRQAHVRVFNKGYVAGAVQQFSSTYTIPQTPCGTLALRGRSIAMLGPQKVTSFTILQRGFRPTRLLHGWEVLHDRYDNRWIYDLRWGEVHWSGEGHLRFDLSCGQKPH